MEKVFEFIGGLLIVILLGFFSYGAIRLNLNRDQWGFPETRRRRKK